MAKVKFTEIKSRSHNFYAYKQFVDKNVKDFDQRRSLYKAIDRIQELNERESYGQRALGYRDSQKFTSDALIARALGVAKKIGEDQYSTKLSQDRAIASLLGGITIQAHKHGNNLFKTLTGESSIKDLKFTEAYYEAAEMLYGKLNHVERAVDSAGIGLLDEFADTDINDPTNKRSFISQLKKAGIWDEMTEVEQALIQEGLEAYYGN